MDGGRGTVWEELSFLASPGELADWRLILLCDAALEVGLLDALPATTSDVASRLGLDAHAVRVVLEALAVWRVVEPGPGRAYHQGPAAPSTDAAAVVHHHARSLRGWATKLDQRLRGEPADTAGPGPLAVRTMLAGLAVNGGESAPAAVDACLGRAPGARRVLDLGGGHGEYAIEFARRGLAVTMQDRPEVVELARRQGRLAAAGVELFAGDLFETLPVEPFDLVFCAGVVYTMGADRNQELFRRARAVIVPGGSLAVHTFLRGTDPLAAIFAVQMLSAVGADTHGEDDLRRWLAAAGYGSVEVRRLRRRPESLLLASPSSASAGSR